MIARMWRGWAPAGTADDYQRHYDHEVATNLRQVPGFRGARLLRAADGDQRGRGGGMVGGVRPVLFTSITFFDDLTSVRGFAGTDFEHAVVEDAARAALSRWDERVTHHEVAVDL